ncbi:MAG: hypothetical protein ACR2RB_00805 [Gammaproteobacteria bacterium]
MSLVTEILDRLSGVAIVREQLSETTRNVDKLGLWLLDHEKRLATLEVESKLLPAKKTKKRKR